MQLAAFITNNIEPILMEWELFARSIWPPGAAAEPADLRDSAEEILRAVVADMATSQTLRGQQEKSAGRGVRNGESDRLDHASQVHGTGRVGSGFLLPAVVSEYRALRASVLRLWRASVPMPHMQDVDDLTRFNESLDQSLALAVSSFMQRIDSSRNMFLRILGHDVRNPLSAITFTAQAAISESGDRPELRRQLVQIAESTNAISALITDLAVFTSTTMGTGMPLTPASTDMRTLCDEVVREVRAAYPKSSIQRNMRGDLAGTWDTLRLRQLIGNLLGNALQHGSPTEAVVLTADGTDSHTVVITVHNSGPPIPADLLPTIFNPLVRGPDSMPHNRRPGSVGLGLYIVREIAAAHGGTAELASTAADGTTATVRLPRHARK